MQNQFSFQFLSSICPSHVPPIILPWYPSDLFQVRNLQQKEMITTELWPRDGEGEQREGEHEREINEPTIVSASILTTKPQYYKIKV